MAPGQSSIVEETGIGDPGFLSLIGGCLTWDPKARLSADQIFEHPWLGNVERKATARVWE
jgi:serine/threonine protein kinase